MLLFRFFAGASGYASMTLLDVCSEKKRTLASANPKYKPVGWSL